MSTKNPRESNTVGHQRCISQKVTISYTRLTSEASKKLASNPTAPKKMHYHSVGIVSTPVNGGAVVNNNETASSDLHSHHRGKASGSFPRLLRLCRHQEITRSNLTRFKRIIMLQLIKFSQPSLETETITLKDTPSHATGNRQSNNRRSWYNTHVKPRAFQDRPKSTRCKESRHKYTKSTSYGCPSRRVRPRRRG